MNVKTLQILTLASGLILLNACGSSNKKSTPDTNTTVPDSNTSTPIATSITHNGTSYGFVTSPHTGKIWLDRNLGAARVCEGFDDDACYGDYYQWGRNTDGHEDSKSSTTNILATDINNPGSQFITTTEQDWTKSDGNGELRKINWSKSDASSICPMGFRVPIKAEYQAELFDIGSEEIQKDNMQKAGNSSDRRVNAYKSFLKIPASGFRHRNANLAGTASTGGLWLNSGYTNIANLLEPHTLQIKQNYSNISASSMKAFARPVRCIKN